jgi:hypothetical protein
MRERTVAMTVRDRCDVPREWMRLREAIHGPHFPGIPGTPKTGFWCL